MTNIQKARLTAANILKHAGATVAQKERARELLIELDNGTPETKNSACTVLALISVDIMKKDRDVKTYRLDRIN